MNLLELQKALNLKNYRTELNKCTYDDGSFQYYEIGIEDGKSNWFWFYSYNEDLTAGIDLFFRERYNCNTGKTIKTFRCGWLFAQHVEKKTNFNLFAKY